MSRYTCEVSVKRDGAWQTMDSAELVPGDVVDVSDSSLNTFPADFVLLSGDAIVNESMLTGESVPISKVPLESKNVELLTEPGSDLPAELARHALFSGTRIVRVRKVPPSPGAEPEAIAMVLRTGAPLIHLAARQPPTDAALTQASTRPRARSFGPCSSPSRLAFPSTATRSASSACSP